MGRERWFRENYEGRERPFDWYVLAKRYEIPPAQARLLYEQAASEVEHSPYRNTETLYRELLERARSKSQTPTPGKVSRTMRLEAQWNDRDIVKRTPTALGKRALSSYIAPTKRGPRRAAHEPHSRLALSDLLMQLRVQLARVRDQQSIAMSHFDEDRLDQLDEQAQALEARIAAAVGERSAPGESAPEPIEALPGYDAVHEVLAGLARQSSMDPDTGALAEQSLPARFRARMERAYGQRLEHVRIRQDSDLTADQQAVTRGRDIFLAPEVRPDSPEGERVLAHELAHVAQQARPNSSWKPRPTVAALEADAHRASLRALAGQAASVRLSAPAGLALTFTDRVDEEEEREEAAASAPSSAPAQPPSVAAPAAPAQAEPEPVSTSAPAPAPAPAPNAARSATSAHAAPGGSGSRAVRPAGAASTPTARPGSVSGAELLLPEAPDTLSESAQARLDSIDTSVREAGTRVGELPTAEASTASARDAVTEPDAETEARGQAGVAQVIDDRPPPSPAIEAACERIREVIRAKRPPDEDALVDAQPREMAAEAGGEMNADIELRADSVRDGYTDMENPPPGQPARTPVPVELPPEQVELPAIDAAAGAPDELPPEEVSLEGDLAAQRTRIEGAGMTSAPAELVEDGPIADARVGLTDLETMAASDPADVLAAQTAAIAGAASDMQALQEAAEQALTQARSGTVGTLGTTSTDITGSEEEQRALAGERMQSIFDSARTGVDALLQPLSSTALARWDAGVDSLASAFESSLASVKERIEERYEVDNSGWGILNPLDDIGAGLTQAWDYVAGLPDWAVEEYDSAEQTFADGCTELITDISRDVNAVIEDCQGIVQQARTDIDAIVTSLPEELQTWAQGEAERFNTELDALDSQITDTQDGLNQDLVDRSNAAVQEVRERVHELREAAQGVVGRIADAVTAFLEDPARFIIDGLLRVVGIPPANFWSMVEQLGDVIDGIAEDPMGFANNLMAGVGQGFQGFFDNFPVHLGQSLFAWLFSKMGEAGVAMPMDFSIPSIVSVVLDVMGISWDRIRVLLARHIGEQNVAHIDRAYDIITTFIARGPLGLVELLREQLDPASIVDMIRETAIRYLMETIVTQVATRILMMLNPAGAILQAIEAIYRVLSWVYENAARIFTLLEAVVSGAAQVLAGNVGGLANLVEYALVGLMVPVIDFLADYIGLGGVPAAIRDMILGLQERVEQILDRVIAFIAEQARALLGAMGLGGEQAEDDDTQGDDESDIPPVSFDAHTGDEGDLEPHRIYVEVTGGSPEIMIASEPQRALDQIRRGAFQQLLNGPDHVNTRIEITDLLVQARTSAAAAEAESDRSRAAQHRQDALRNMQRVSQRLADLGADYPLPGVGTHAAMTALADSEAPPDGRTRHSHHVPAAALGQVMRDELQSAAEHLDTEYDGNPAVATVTARLRAAVTAMAPLLAGHGNGLSTILLHPDTHKHGEINIHGRNIAAHIEQELQRREQGINVQRVRIMNTARQQILVNPRTDNWRQFLRDCEQVVATRAAATGAQSGARAGGGLSALLTETRAELEALEREEMQTLTYEVLLSAKSVLRQVFVEAYNSGEAAVQAALGASRVDGDNPSSVLPRLRREAQQCWQPFHTSIRF